MYWVLIELEFQNWRWNFQIITLHYSRITWSTIIVWVFLIMSTLILSAKEVFQLMHSQKLYFLNWENWVQWGIIINVVTISFHSNPLESINDFTFLVKRWQHHAAAIGVFLVWGELMLMVGRLPTFGMFLSNTLHPSAVILLYRMFLI